MFQISEKQYILTALGARAKQKSWFDVDSLFNSKNWLGYTKKRSPIGFHRVVDILHKNNAPVSVLHPDCCWNLLICSALYSALTLPTQAGFPFIASQFISTPTNIYIYFFILRLKWALTSWMTNPATDIKAAIGFFLDWVFGSCWTQLCIHWHYIQSQ